MAYAPGVQNRAGDYLMRGMESFGQSIGGAIIDVAKTNKENTKKAKVMDSAWDLMQGQGLVPAGASPQDFSVKDKASMFDGVMTATDLMGKAVARKANEAQADLYAAQAEKIRNPKPGKAGTFEIINGKKVFWNTDGSASLVKDDADIPTYPMEEGDPASVLLGDNVMGVADKESRRYNPQLIKYSTNIFGEVVPEADTKNIPRYENIRAIRSASRGQSNLTPSQMMRTAARSGESLSPFELIGYPGTVRKISSPEQAPVEEVVVDQALTVEKPVVASPKVGEERNGYIFQGGDPSKASSWRKK